MDSIVLEEEEKILTTICDDLLAIRWDDKPMFQKQRIENGFEVFGTRNDGTTSVVLRAIYRDGQIKVDYDETLISFDFVFYR